MRMSMAVQDVQQTLLTCDVLCYKPSLSVEVHDALFSYWRLPLAVREELPRRLPAPSFTKSSGDDGVTRVSIDWERVAVCVQQATQQHAIANPIEVTWAFALQAETLLTTLATTTIQFPGITHGDQVHKLLQLMKNDSSEFYMTFLVLTTILERALYDLYHRHEAELRSSSETTPAAPTKRKKKNMILRDLLHSESLVHLLPDGLLRVLKILFLPSGLNLRNLVWHGFMVPAECPKCFSCLLVVLLLALTQIEPQAHDDGAEPVENADEPLFTVKSYDDRFVLTDPELCGQLSQLFDVKADDQAQLIKLLAGAEPHASQFVPRGRRQLVKKAFKALLAGDELWFLFALLPVLEHAIRVKFIATNQAKFGLSSEYGTAQIDAYYSTLDGFGQRDKHQVLLHSNVVLSDDSVEHAGANLNALYTALPSAALAVCLDLFMMASGPNLRAKLCHGEADLSTLLRPGLGGSKLSTASQLLVLSWLSLCRNEELAEAEKPQCSSVTMVVQAFEKSYSSSFHPFYQLRRELTTAFTVGKQFSELRSRWTRFRLESFVNPDSEAMIWVDFASSIDSVTKFGVLEKASRIHEFQGLLETSLFSWDAVSVNGTPPPPPSRSQAKSFSVLLEQLYGKLSLALAQLSRHFQESHTKPVYSSAFLGLVSAASGEPISRIFDANIRLNPAIEAHLLALSDDDGLSVAACMMEIVASSQRSSTSFQSRILELQQLIADGTARTNHRRSFLNSVFFLPVFEIVQALSLALVEHQVMHFVSHAALQHQQQSSPEPIATSPVGICAHPRQFELLQRKLLQFITAFEGCAGASDSAGLPQKSSEKALLLALQFLDSKAMKTVLRVRNEV